MRLGLIGCLGAACLVAQFSRNGGRFGELKIHSIGPPDTPSEIAVLGPADVTAHEKGVSALRICSTMPGGGIDGKSTSSQRAKAAQNGGETPKDPLFVHDEPPGGGDGSFELSLGKRVAEVAGVLATHSHREPHLFWLVDRKGNMLIRRSLVLPPDSVIEIELEKFSTGDRDFNGIGTLRMQQTTVPGYAKVALKDHPFECDRDYVWKVTKTEGVTLTAGGKRGFQVPMNGMNKLHMSKIKVWQGPDTNNKPPSRVYELHSGCATFQICGRFNGCQSITPPAGCVANSWSHQN